MISSQDIQVILIYLALLCVIGWGFRRYSKSFEEYFAGGRCMVWWLLGADSFQSNFSCWIFTGAAGVAYTHGSLVFGFFMVDALGFILAYARFAQWFRQLNVVTALDAVRQRFGARDERFFAVLSIVSALAFASMRVVGLSIILSHAFAFAPSVVIGLTMAVVVFVALLGGSWAVAAMNMVQLVVVVSVTTVVAVLAVRETGGWNAFIAQVPTDHWEIFKPLGTTPYDWLFVISGLLAAFYNKNNLLFVSKYLAARDERDARRSSLIPFFGYLIMPVIWMIPVFAAFTLVPELITNEKIGHAGEWSYIAVCTKILPAGLLGLVVVCMLAATVSSVGMALNANAGIAAQNLYRPWRKGRASDSELVRAGKIATFVLGVIVGVGSIGLGASGLTLFDALLYIGAYISVPVAVPLFFGLFVRDEPWWAPRATVIFSIATTIAIYQGLPAMLPFWASSSRLSAVASYLASNKFVATNLLIVPASAIFFFASTRWARTRTEVDRARHAAFFLQSTQAVPLTKSRDLAHAQQSRLIGWLLAGAAGFILVFGLLPNPLTSRMAIMSCSLLPAFLAACLLLWGRRLARHHQ